MQHKVRKVDSLELMKLLADRRRTRILQLSEKEPISVKQLAEMMDEKPSRLYYHLHKLEEAGLIECVMTKAQGNLIEKFYQRVQPEEYFSIDKGLLFENVSLFSSFVQQMIEPAFRLLEAQGQAKQESKLENREETTPLPRVAVNIPYDYITTTEWKKRLKRAVCEMAGIKPEDLTDPEEEQLIPDSDEMGTYQTVIISYRVEDVEKLRKINDAERKGNESEEE